MRHALLIPTSPSVRRQYCSASARGVFLYQHVTYGSYIRVPCIPCLSAPLSDRRAPLSDYPLSEYPLSGYPLSEYPLSDYPLSEYPLSEYPLSEYPLSDRGHFPLFAEPTFQHQLQQAWQKSWNQQQSLLQNLRFRERGPLKSWRPETMAAAIMSVLREGEQIPRQK